jgi:hypothetical protein
MWQKHRVTEQVAEKAPGEYSASIYLEAYHYALDLCDNPAIAREVASRFVKCLEAEAQPASEFDPATA